MALELNLKSEFSDSLMQKLEALDKMTFAELRNIEQFVQNELDLKTNRAKLQKEIEALGNIFFNALTTKHPKLNDADLKLCSFIVLNLSNKEIAVSKNIATNSVKISKNRLKKKLLINKESRQVILEGELIVLTSHEFDMLWKLASNASFVVERSTLYTELIGREYDGVDRSADVRISRIRKKLKDDPQNPFRIKTIWGKGFFFVPDAWD